MTREQFRNRFIVGFSIFMGLMFFVMMSSSGANVLMSLGSGVLMGFMTLGVAMMSYGYKGFLQQRSFTDKKQASQSTDHHQSRTVEIDLPKDQAIQVTLDALNTLDKQPVPVPDDVLVQLENLLPRTQRLTIHEVDEVAGYIRAGLKARILGIPEFIDFSRIEIQLKDINPNTTQVQIESKANSIFDTYDFGKNLHYVNTISLYLRRESQQITAGSRLQNQGLSGLNEQPDSDNNQQATSQS